MRIAICDDEKRICAILAEKVGKICLMILANLGQRSYNSRTTFPKYTDSVPETSGQEHCPRGTS